MILFCGVCYFLPTAACARNLTTHHVEEEGIRPFFNINGLFKLNRKEWSGGTRQSLGTSRRSLWTLQFEANKPNSSARLSMLIKISETRKKKKTYIQTIVINTFWAGKLTVWVTGLISSAVTSTICGDNVHESYDWTDAESTSIWVTRSLS